MTERARLDLFARRIIRTTAPRGERKRLPQVAVFLVPEGEMKMLKLTYRERRLGRPKRARRKRALGCVDVLAFPEPSGFPHPEKRAPFLGEVYLNADYARTDQRRLHYLLIHGILHLLGYDHESKRDTIRMEKLEEECMKKLFPTTHGFTIHRRR